MLDAGEDVLRHFTPMFAVVGGTECFRDDVRRLYDSLSRVGRTSYLREAAGVCTISYISLEQRASCAACGQPRISPFVHVGPSEIDSLSQKEEVPVTWRPLTTVGDDFFRTAAVSVTVTVDVRCPVDRLWDVLSADDAVVSWSPAVTEARWASASRGVGAIREVTLGGVLGVKEHFYRWDKNERMTFSAEAVTLPGVRAFAEDYVVTPTPSGSRLEWTVAMEFTRRNSLLARVVRPVLRFAIRDLARGVRRQAR